MSGDHRDKGGKGLRAVADRLFNAEIDEKKLKYEGDPDRQKRLRALREITEEGVRTNGMQVRTARTQNDA